MAGTTKVPRLALLLSLALALAGSKLHSAFSMPVVDLAPNVASASVTQTTNVAIWTSTDVSISAGATVKIYLPKGVSMPSQTLSFFPALLTMKHTYSPTGSFIAEEVTITTGTVNSSARSVSFELPQALYPGKVYFRFRKAFGVANPYTPGQATLRIEDPWGISSTSKAYYIAPTYTANVILTPLSGTVLFGSSTGTAGALIYATTDGGPEGFHPDFMGPGLPGAAPRDTTSNAYTTYATYDGSYILNVPPGTYYMTAFAARMVPTGVNTGLASLQMVSSSAATVTVALTPVPQNFTLPSYP